MALLVGGPHHVEALVDSLGFEHQDTMPLIAWNLDAIPTNEQIRFWLPGA